LKAAPASDKIIRRADGLSIAKKQAAYLTPSRASLKVCYHEGRK
jgi:hypothetical protein